MICAPCRVGGHVLCRGGTWCDCQHRPRPGPLVVAGMEFTSALGDPGGPDGGEPQL